MEIIVNQFPSVASVFVSRRREKNITSSYKKFESLF